MSALIAKRAAARVAGGTLATPILMNMKDEPRIAARARSNAQSVALLRTDIGGNERYSFLVERISVSLWPEDGDTQPTFQGTAEPILHLRPFVRHRRRAQEPGFRFHSEHREGRAGLRHDVGKLPLERREVGDRARAGNARSLGDAHVVGALMSSKTR